LLTQEQGNCSIRRIAAATGMTKSSVHRHRQAIERRNQPGVAVVEMPSGHQWLQRLVWAVVYVFGVKHGIGNDTLSEFFQLLRLERHWVSPSALQWCTSQAGKADSELSPATKQLQQVPTKLRSVSVRMKPCLSRWCWCYWTFHPAIFFLEAQAKDRSYQTWQGWCNRRSFSR